MSESKLLYGSAEDLLDFENEAGLTEEARTALLSQYAGTLGTYKEGSIVKGRVLRLKTYMLPSTSVFLQAGPAVSVFSS